jgi:plasmid stabilization system protein ParE
MMVAGFFCGGNATIGVPGAVAKIQRKIFVILVDLLVKPEYNTHMTQTQTTRKKRVDRNHIIYELRVNGLNYIGVTAKTESTVNKSVRARAAKHYYRAKTETKDWLLCAELRKLASKDEIEILVHAVIRGKAEAHKEEVRIRREIRPALNTDRRGD